MSTPIALRPDYDAAALRRAEKATKDAAQGRRLLAQRRLRRRHAHRRGSDRRCGAADRPGLGARLQRGRPSGVGRR